MNTKMLSPSEVARRLGLSDSTIRMLCATGELEHYRFGRSYRISEEQLAEYIDRQRAEVAPAVAETKRRPPLARRGLENLRAFGYGLK